MGVRSCQLQYQVTQFGHTVDNNAKAVAVLDKGVRFLPHLCVMARLLVLFGALPWRSVRFCFLWHRSRVIELFARGNGESKTSRDQTETRKSPKVTHSTMHWLTVARIGLLS